MKKVGKIASLDADTSRTAKVLSSLRLASTGKLPGGTVVQDVRRTLCDRSGLRLVRRRTDVGPAVPPFNLVDQQDAAAVDLVLLPLTRTIHVDCVVDDPHVPGFVRHH